MLNEVMTVCDIYLKKKIKSHFCQEMDPKTLFSISNLAHTVTFENIILGVNRLTTMMQAISKCMLFTVFLLQNTEVTQFQM